MDTFFINSLVGLVVLAVLVEAVELGGVKRLVKVSPLEVNSVQANPV